NMYELQLSLVDGAGIVLDAALPQRFGFREFWIDGRDFYLNGSRIFLCAVPFDNAQIGAAWATYESARESLERLKSFGVNFVYTHNYGCEPGTHLSFAEILRAADDEGMLVSFSQPHFGQYQWKTPDADQTNGYARHAAFYVQAAENHPSVVFYSMSHNATGTEEEMNPDMIDGVQDVRNQWSGNNVKQALRAEAIVNQLDPGRIVYHHSSGNLSSMHTANFYANFAPIQEMSDWFEHWATQGVKPVFLCEYGVPIFWDWMMYRGWYKGARNFGSAQAPWEFCLAEWDAQFFGDEAYKLTDLEKECLRWEATRFRTGQLWHRWDYPRNAIESSDFEQRNAVMAMYLTDNLRSFRTWGVSAFCPWDHGTYWKLREGVKRGRKDIKVDWDKLQRPGFSPDYIDGQMEWINTSFERSDWIPTVAAQALMRNNQPLLAYIGGKLAAFTSKDHNFYPGDTVEKQIIVINNSRQTVKCDCSWSLALPKSVSGRKEVSVETGQQARVPLSFVLPAQTRPGRYELTATVKFNSGETQADTFIIDVLSQPAAFQTPSRIALFDPKGETTRLLGAMGIQCAPVDANADLSSYDIFIVGTAAMTVDSPAPDIARVRDGLKVVMFEQTPEVLEQRFGFRVAEYGLRQVFKRVPDYPLLAGIADENLRNWRGEATLLPPRLHYEIGPRHAPEVKWCDIPVTRLWRAGNRGNVASVLIEKPARGDFMPILDGGFSLQFSPLLEYREGKGLVLFCQMDVTGRTESDPAAERLTRNILQYVTTWKPASRRSVLYVGDPAGQRHLEHAGFAPGTYQGGKLSTDNILVVGSGGEKKLAGDTSAIADFL
ncbi:MAG TPA: glycoside hydrolase family 2 TIM barrel-domain containing protein, partial [Verrucomicrobiae bacterium]|nr:glycoside hydrolase family 2 TIM barrel-domain containing protein [Verrucomicrobiae bacterium]